jgi:hypothetical protein
MAKNFEELGSLYKNDLFHIEQCKEEETRIQEKNPVRFMKSEKNTNRPAKWTKLNKVNVLLSHRQKDLLDTIAKKAMRGREAGGEKERITANTILRCLIDVLESKTEKLNLIDVGSEEELRNRILSQF